MSTCSRCGAQNVETTNVGTFSQSGCTEGQPTCGTCFEQLVRYGKTEREMKEQIKRQRGVTRDELFDFIGID